MKQLITLLLLISISSANKLVDLMKKHEGFSSTPYRDTHNHLSIGYGINLTYGISEEEAEILLIHRLNVVNTALEQHKWFNNLSSNRKIVLISMAYQLGINGLLSFKDMIWCIKHNYYNGAANRMINSLWYKQSGIRARELVQLMKKG